MRRLTATLPPVVIPAQSLPSRKRGRRPSLGSRPRFREGRLCAGKTARVAVCASDDSIVRPRVRKAWALAAGHGISGFPTLFPCRRELFLHTVQRRDHDGGVMTQPIRRAPSQRSLLRAAILAVLHGCFLPSAYSQPLDPPILAIGRVLVNPAVVNLYWHDEWDNAVANQNFLQAKIDAEVRGIMDGYYLNGADQYGVGRGRSPDCHNAGRMSRWGNRGKPGSSPKLHSAFVAWSRHLPLAVLRTYAGTA